MLKSEEVETDRSGQVFNKDENRGAAKKSWIYFKIQYSTIIIIKKKNYNTIANK